jgi:hypothetical protein
MSLRGEEKPMIMWLSKDGEHIGNNDEGVIIVDFLGSVFSFSTAVVKQSSER